jgi:hypothetical protein
MLKIVASINDIKENKMTKAASFIANAKEDYKQAMDSYGTAIIKVKTK